MTFWIPPLAEARPSNASRKGDADHGVKPYDAQAEKRKKDRKKREREGRGSGSFDENKVKRGMGDQGGQFVSKGDTGHMVGTVQGKLGIEQTGVYDAGTAASVVAFQKRHGLVVDGIVGRQTALALTGQYERARQAGVGALGPETSKLVGGDSRDGSRGRRSRRRGSRRAKGERVRGGAVIAQLEEGERHPLAEAVVDRLGNVHDEDGKFTFKTGAKGKGVAAALIPEYDPSQLTFGKSAGGSNGARIAHHKDGSKWLVKAYQGNEDRVATELLANAVYRELGARVPRAGFIKLHNGKRALAYPLLEGKPKPHVFRKGRPNEEVGKHFMADALLANWDVAGMDDDNILWDPAGQPFRVDQGGTLEFRAMGGRKGFGDVPYEVTTMLRKGAQGRRSSFVTGPGLLHQAKTIEETLTPGKIDAFVEAAGFKDAKMKERVRKALKARVAWMGRFGRGETGMPVPPAPPLKEAASWLAPLLEAALPYEWKEALHPRDEHGKFVEKIGGLPGGKAIQLDAKTTIKKDKDGTFRVVRSGGIIKGFRTPEDAARAALDRSAKGKEADSVGGATSYKDFNAYLKARGAGDVDKPAPGEKLAWFGGKYLNSSDLTSAVAKLKVALDLAEASSDKYVQRQIPTVKARLAEAETKLKAVGGASPAPSRIPSPPPKGGLTPVGDGPPAVGTVVAGPDAKKLPVGTWVRAKHSASKDWAGASLFQAVSGGYFQGYDEQGKQVGKAGPIVSDLYNVKVVEPPASQSPGNLTTAAIAAGTPVAPTSQWSTPQADALEKFPPGSKIHFGAAEHPWTVVGASSTNPNEIVAQKDATGNFSTHPASEYTKGKVQPIVTAEPVAADPVSAVDALSGNKPFKAGKPIKGMQSADGLGAFGSKPKLGELKLAPGDIIQVEKGGWKWTLIEPGTVPGAWKVQAANGKTKFLSKHKPVGLVKKADGSKLETQQMPPASSSAPPAPKPSSGGSAPEIAQMALNPQTIMNKLSAPSLQSGITIGSLKDGDVIASPDGKIGVLKPGEPAYTGYVAAYDIKTGQKFEAPAGKPPTKFTTDTTVKAAAAAALAKAQSGTKVTTAVGQSGTAGNSSASPQVGPPPAFQGIASWYSAKPHVPTTTQVSLTAEERSAITSYTGSGYSEINGALRNSESVKSLSTAKKAAAIKRALAKGKVKQDVWIGRKTNNPTWKSAAVAGKVIGDNGVLSSSYDENSWDGDIYLNILIREGMPALNVEGISNHPGEKEILLPPGSLFHVLKREEKGSKTVLYVEMI